MNTGQTMMVILAMMLLGTLSLNVNSTLINSSSTSLEMEAQLDALSYGQTMLDEILSKSFDQKTANGTRIFYPADMSSYLGYDGGTEFFVKPDSSYLGAFKSLTKYNDVDDYNGYWRIVTNARLGQFTIRDTVQYVSETCPDSVKLSTQQTFYKRVTVYITSPYLTKDKNGNVFPLVMRDLAVYRKYF
jgi:hypothetical protein